MVDDAPSVSRLLQAWSGGDVAALVVVHVDTYVPTLAGRGTVVATIR